MRQNTSRYGESAAPPQRLTGSRNAVRAHVHARTALLDLLTIDPDVLAIFNDDAFESVVEMAGRMGAMGEALACRAGLTGRAALFAPDATVRPPAEYQALNETYTHEVRRLMPVLEARLVALVVDTWHLGWPWLVFELRESYVRLLNILITGDGFLGAFGVTLPAPPLPESGESRDAYLARLRTFYTPR